MNYTKIENNKAFFRKKENDGEWIEISEITGEDILYLLDKLIEDDDFEIVEYSNKEIKNECHNIIYKNLYSQFNEILLDKDNILDKNQMRYKEIIEKYGNND